MYRDKKISVVVPCHNEERQVGRVFDTMPNYVDSIVVIDDRSTDRTIEVVKSRQAGDPRIVLIVHEQNQGVGGAIASGYKWSRDNDIDVAVVMAGDGQMDPDDMPALLDAVIVDGVNYAKGNRLLHQQVVDIPRSRLIGNVILSFLTKIASGYWHVADSQTGYAAIDKTALRVVDWEKMYKRYGQPNDLLVTLNVFQFKVRDVPVRPVYNIGEVSKLKIQRVVFTISRLLVRKFLWRMKERYIIRDFHPLVLFYFLAGVLGVLAVIFFIRLIVLWIIQGEAPLLTAIALMFLTSLSLNSAFFAMYLDMEANRHLR